MSFSKIINQERAISLLLADFESGRLAESYLFVGPKGVGKRMAALELAKALNCQAKELSRLEPSFLDLEGLEASPNSDRVVPCDQCPSCKKVDFGTHPDVFVLDFDSQATLLDLKDEERSRQKDLRIEAVRILIKRAMISPLEGKKKVFIIDGAESLNAESANALLKILEESTRQAHWILLALSLERVIPTIRSRCRRIPFIPRISLQEEKPFQEWMETILDWKNKPEAKEIFRVSSLAVNNKKKGTQRKCAEEFLQALVLDLSTQLRSSGDISIAEKLSLVLESQQELRRNISPQLVLDSLLLSLVY